MVINSLNFDIYLINSAYYKSIFTVIIYVMKKASLTFLIFLLALLSGNAQAPTTPSTNLTFGTIDGNRMRLYFTKGDGVNRIIIAKEDSPVTALPTDGVDYISGDFGAGNEISPGEFVVYEGTGNNGIYITGLNHTTTYHFRIIEFNGGNSTTQYLTSSFLEGNQATLTYPTTQPSNISFSNVLGESMTVSWTNGDGDGRILIAKEGSAVDIEPNSLVSYNAAPSGMYNASYEISGSSNYVLYQSTGTSTNITNLKPNKTYHFALFEYNGSSGKVFLTSTSTVSTPATTANQLTTTYPTLNATNFAFNLIYTDRLRFNFTKGNGARRIVVAKKDSAVDALPVDGQDYTSNSTFGTGSDLGGGNFIIYEGTGNSFISVYGLDHTSTYHFKVFEYNGINAETFYLIGSDSNSNLPIEGNETTLTYPTMQASNITFSNILGQSMTVNWDNGNGYGRILIARENAAVDVEPSDFVNYNATGGGMNNPSYEIGTGNYVLYQSTGTSANLTNLDPNITYHFALFEYNGPNSKVFLTTNSPVPTPPATANQLTPIYPTLNATNFSFNLIYTDRLRFNFTKGNGARRIVVAKKGSAVDALPVDGQDYTSNSTFGSGSDLGGGNFVVYEGTGNSFISVYGLDHTSTYHFKVFEYNGTGVDISYLTGNDSVSNPVLEGNESTLTYPTTQASNITFSNVLGETMTVNWDNGDGYGRILICREDAPVNVEPSDFVNYNATGGGMGNSAYEIGTGNYVLYQSTGTSANLTNLNPNTTYYFALYEYNGPNSKVFLTSNSPIPTAGPIANQLTTAYPSINATNATFNLIDVDRLRFNFTKGNGARRIVVAKKDSAVDVDPIDGQDYTASSTFGSGDDLGNGNFVVYKGTGNSFISINGLEPSTTYHFKVFEYNGSNLETFYKKDSDTNGNSPLAFSQSTVLYPSIQASNILFTNAIGTGMNVNWTNGSGSGRILIAREGSPVDVEPTDFVNYNASGGGMNNPSYEIGTGNYVLYAGAGSSTTLTNLTPYKTYHFALYEYSGSSKKLYLTSTSPISTPGATASRYLGAPPTQNASNFTFNLIDGDRLRYRFTTGGGDRRIVVVKEGSAVDVNPNNEQTYLADNTFGLGDDLGGGNYVIFDGVTPNSSGEYLYGLNHSTTYYFKVFEYNGSGTDTYYLTVSDDANQPPLEKNQATVTYPSTQASGLSFSDISGSSIRINWVKGNGSGRILIAKKGSSVDVEPTNFTNYIANTNGMGNPTYEIGTNNYVLYQGANDGTGNGITISGLELNTNYHFALFEYNGNFGKVFLNTSSTIPTSGDIANQSTTTYPSLAATNFSFIPDGNRIKYSFIKGNGARRIVVAKMGSPIDAIPVDGQEYNANQTFSIGDDLGNNNFVIYDGNSNGTNLIIDGLNPSTLYYFKVFEYNKEGVLTYYLINPNLEGSATTLSPPTIQAGNVTIQGKTTNSITMSWVEGNGFGQILIARPDNAVDIDPTDLVNYNYSYGGMGNPSYEIGSGNYVLYSRPTGTNNNNNITLTNLQPNINYYFSLYEYSGEFGKQYLKPAYTFQEQTWGIRPTVQTSNAFFEEGATSMNVKFTPGDGLNTLVLCKIGSAVDIDPTDLTSYNSYGFIPAADIGNGNYVVYDSKNGPNEFNLTNLTQGETYHFAFYEYAISDNGELYLTPGYAISQATAIPPTLLPTNLTITPPCENVVQVGWDIDLADPNTGDGRIVILSEAPLNTLPTSAVDYIADFDYGQGSAIGNGFVVYKGSGILFPPNLLTPFTNYYINLFEYNGIATDPAFNLTPLQGIIGDETLPIVTCKNITVQLDTNGLVSILPTDVDNSSTDNCTIETLSLDISDFTCADIGNNIVTLTVTDTYGNLDSCTATVTVTDDSKPTLTAISDKIIGPDAGTCDSTLLDYISETTVADNCNVQSVTQSPIAGTTISGENTQQVVTITANDGNGNTETTTFTVTLDCTILANDDFNLEGFSIYPNPVKDVLTIKSGNLIIDDIEVFDTLGKSLKKVNVIDKTISTKDLPIGVFILRINTDKGIIIRKIVKI